MYSEPCQTSKMEFFADISDIADIADISDIADIADIFCGVAGDITFLKNFKKSSFLG